MMQHTYKNMKGLIFGFLSNSYIPYVKPLDQIAEYYGEKWAFYFAWLLHYTSWLIIPAVIGLIIYIIEIANW